MRRRDRTGSWAEAMGTAQQHRDAMRDRMRRLRAGRATATRAVENTRWPAPPRDPLNGGPSGEAPQNCGPSVPVDLPLVWSRPAAPGDRDQLLRMHGIAVSGDRPMAAASIAARLSELAAS